MNVEILGKSLDVRTETPVIYAKLTIPDYLGMVGDSFTDFSIQRRREKHKAYARMKMDIVKGALLPSITLAVKFDQVSTFLPLIERSDFDELSKALGKTDQVHILDGLQRTYILKDLEEEKTEFKPGQTLLVEFWFESNIRNLIYRIIVLNAGQKPMSMRHQVELLFMNVQDRLEGEIPGLKIFKERENSRRAGPRRYALDKIATAYQCFITKTPEVQRDNIVAQKLVEEDILASSEDELGEQFEDFKTYLGIYASLDDEVCRVYVHDKEGGLPSGNTWFGSENVMNSFFSAVSYFGSSSERIERVKRACKALLLQLQNAKEGEDPLGLAVLQTVINGFPTRKVNVGFATRKLLTAGWKEFFRDEGATSLEENWKAEAE